MPKRKFKVSVELEFDLVLDQKVIDAVDDGWRQSLYNLHTPEEIAAHIAFAVGVQGFRFSSLDGWADQPDSHCEIKMMYSETSAVEE